MIEVENLTKYYGSFPAIKNITFKVKRGEILGFLGPNGAGKTTTMRILAGFFPPTSGRAAVAGYDVFEKSLEVRKRVGYMPETVPLYKDMTVNEYLNFAATVKGVPSDEIEKKVDKVMGECGIKDVRNKLIGTLSKGYRQRVGIAQALVNDPEVLILDEPTIGLDPKQIIEIRELIKGLAGERTIILSTHILPEVSMVCSRVIIINEGELVAVDTPENLNKKLSGKSELRVEVAGDKEKVVKSIRSIPGVVNVEEKEKRGENSYLYLIEAEKERDIRGELASKIVSSGFSLLELTPVGLSLEDIFIKLVTEEGEVVQ
ncbi:MAG: ABC transporter ATP-binding protein [Acidobacteria bacterium]|nr:ABC transporter ATP-binding protein [Acidobacteriota bacterium]